MLLFLPLLCLAAASSSAAAASSAASASASFSSGLASAAAADSLLNAIAAPLAAAILLRDGLVRLRHRPSRRATLAPPLASSPHAALRLLLCLVSVLLAESTSRVSSRRRCRHSEATHPLSTGGLKCWEPCRLEPIVSSPASATANRPASAGTANPPSETDPDRMETYHGYVRTPGDAIKLFEACRLGLLPRVQRRLSEKERQSIRSGSVFVWDEREAGMRRWTDGKSWSASRVSGSFLTYREMEGKRGGGFGSGRRGAGKTPDSGRGSDEDHDDGEPEGYRYKADGLMKQSFSITTSTNQHLHLISYYSRPQPGQPDLNQPSSDPSLRGIVPPKGMYPDSRT
ncbi:hypothetical protein CDD83_5166 [Cordyceps sp. RAO-2017]|nr:hypothetical protein CDD83_5166 [Cordyceps sp. RAO-2017]